MSKQNLPSKGLSFSQLQKQNKDDVRLLSNIQNLKFNIHFIKLLKSINYHIDKTKKNSQCSDVAHIQKLIFTILRQRKQERKDYLQFKANVQEMLEKKEQQRLNLISFQLNREEKFKEEKENEQEKQLSKEEQDVIKLFNKKKKIKKKRNNSQKFLNLKQQLEAYKTLYHDLRYECQTNLDEQSSFNQSQDQFQDIRVEVQTKEKWFPDVGYTTCQRIDYSTQSQKEVNNEKKKQEDEDELLEQELFQNVIMDSDYIQQNVKEIDAQQEKCQESLLDNQLLIEQQLQCQILIDEEKKEDVKEDKQDVEIYIDQQRLLSFDDIKKNIEKKTKEQIFGDRSNIDIPSDQEEMDDHYLKWSIEYEKKKLQVDQKQQDSKLQQSVFNKGITKQTLQSKIGEKKFFFDETNYELIDAINLQQQKALKLQKDDKEQNSIHLIPQNQQDKKNANV